MFKYPNIISYLKINFNRGLRILKLILVIATLSNKHPKFKIQFNSNVKFLYFFNTQNANI